MSAGWVLLLALLASPFVWWLYWISPRRRVPKTVTKAELDRLEAEGKLRQAAGQFMAGIGLVATFALTVYQTFETRREWRDDNAARSEQARNVRFTEALKLLGPDDKAQTNVTGRVAALHAMHSLALENPNGYQDRIIEILQTHVASRAKIDRLKEAGLSDECAIDTRPNNGKSREDTDPEVQAATKLLGIRDEAWQQTDGSHFGTIRLERLYLDNLDLDSIDFRASGSRGAMLSNSYFRRVNFRNSRLDRADFRHAIFADWRTPGYPNIGEVDPRWLYDSEADWRRYRCWVTDFRGAVVTGADFSNAELSGADFRGATIDASTNFEKADISRANFVGTAISKKQVESACGAEQAWLPETLARQNVKLNRC